MESSKECLESIIQKARAWSNCPEKQFHCAICGEKIEGPDKLRDHLRDEHLVRSRVEQVMTAMIASAESQTTHRCKICKKEISWNRADLKLHFKTSHKLTLEHYYVSNILTPSTLREMSPEELRAIRVLSQTKIDPEVIETSFGADAQKNLDSPYLSQGNKDIKKSFKPDDNDHPQKRFCGTRSVGQPLTYPSNIETALAIHEVYLKESTLNSNQQRKRKKNQLVINASKSKKQSGSTNTKVLKATNQERDPSDNIQNTTTTRKLVTISQKELTFTNSFSPSQNGESQTTDHANEATSNQAPKNGSETQPIASDSSERDALSDWLDQCTYVCQYDEFQTKNTEEFQRHLDSQHDLKMAEYFRICKGKLFLDEVKVLCRLCSNKGTQNSLSVNHHLRKVHKITPENYYKQFVLETEKVVISEDESGFYTCPICSNFKSEQKDLEVHLRGYHGVIADEHHDFNKIEEITLVDETETACSDLSQNRDVVQGEIYEIDPNECVDNNVESIEMSVIDLRLNPVFDSIKPTKNEEIFVEPSKNQSKADNTYYPEMLRVNLDSSGTQAQAEIPNPSWNQTDVSVIEDRDQMQESSRDNTNRDSFSKMKINVSDLAEDLEDSTKDRIYTLNPTDISAMEAIDDTSEEPQQVSPRNNTFNDSSYAEIKNNISDRTQKQCLVLDQNSSPNPDDIEGVDPSKFSTNVVADDSYLEKETINADLIKTYDNIKDQFFKMDPNDIIDATILVQKSQKNSVQGSSIIDTVNETVEAKMESETVQEAENVEGNEKEKVLSILNNVKRETKTTEKSGNAVKTEEIGNQILDWVNQCTYTCRLCDGEERLVTNKLETWAYHLSTVHKGWTLAAYKSKHGSVPAKVVSYQCVACGESLNHDRAAIVKHLANSHRGLNLFEYYKKYVSEESKRLEQTTIKEESGESGTNKDEKDPEASGQKSHKRQSDKEDSQGGGYVCQFCNKGWSAPALLKRHMRVHTGEKPFSCTKCDLSFSLKSNLLKHFRRYHTEASAEIVNLIKANKNAKMGIRDNRVRKAETSSKKQSKSDLNDTEKSGLKEGFDIRQDLEKVNEAIDEKVEGGNLTEDDTLYSLENNKEQVDFESDFKKGVVTGLKKKVDSWLPGSKDQNLEEDAASGPRMKSVRYTSKNDPAKAKAETSKEITEKDMKKEHGLNISEKNEALREPKGNDGVFLEEERALETWANACEYTCQDITCDFFANEYNHFYNHLKETHQISTYDYVAKHRTIMTKHVTYDCHIEECSTQIIQTRKNLRIHSEQVHNVSLAQYFQLIEFSKEEYLKLCARASGVDLKSSEDFESKIDDRDEDTDDREMGEFLGQGNIQLKELEWVNACEYSCQEVGCRFLTKEYNALCSHLMNTHKMSLKPDRAQSAMEHEIMITKKVMHTCQIHECSSNVTQTRRSIIRHIQEHHRSLSLNEYYIMHVNKQFNINQDNTETKGESGGVSSSEFHSPAFEKWLKFNIDGGDVTVADLLKSDINEPQLEDKVFFGKENLQIEVNNFTEPNAIALQKQALIECQKSGASLDEDTISRLTKFEGDKNQISRHKLNNADSSLPSKGKSLAKPFNGPKFSSKDWTNQCTFSCKVCQNFKTKKHSKFVWHLKTEHSMSAPAYKNQFGQAISKRVYLTCLICKQKFSHTFKSIHSHMRNNHKLSPEEYYDRFFSKDTEPDPHESSKTDAKVHEDRRLKSGKYESLNEKSRLEAQFDEIQIHNWAEKCIYECQMCKFHKFQTSHRSKFAKHLYKEHKKIKFGSYKNMFGRMITTKTSHKCFLCSSMMTHSYSSIKGHLSEVHQVKIEQYYRDFILGKKREVNNTPEQTKISSAGRGASKNGTSDSSKNDDLNKKSNKDLPTDGIGMLINQKEIRNWAEKCTHSCQICNDFSTLDVYKFEKHLFNSHNKLKLAGYNKRYRTTVTHRVIHKCEICSNDISHKFDSIRLHLRRQHKVKIEKYFGDFILGQSKKDTGQNQKDSNDKDSRCSKISKKNGSMDSTKGSFEDNLSYYSKEDPNAIARWSEQCVYECKIPRCKGYKTKTRDKFNRHLYKDHNKLTCEGYKQFFGTLISQRVTYKCLLCESVVTHNTKSISGHLKQVHKLPLIKYYNEYILSGAKSKEPKSSEKASSTNKHERYSSPEPSPKKPKVLNKVIKSEENLNPNTDKLTRHTEDSDGFYLLKDNSWNGFETNQTIQNQQEDILKAQNRTENDNDNSKELSTKVKVEDFQNVSGENSELIVSRGRLSDILGTFKTATNNSDADIKPRVVPSNLLSNEKTASPIGQSPSKGVHYQDLGPKIKEAGTISKPEPPREKDLEISWMDGCTYNCKLCSTGAQKFNSKEAFEVHVKEQHGVEPTTYVNLLGDPVEEMTYFVCRLCQEMMVKDRGEITNHLQNKHKTPPELYRAMEVGLKNI